jgi:hypothetical protein
VDDDWIELLDELELEEGRTLELIEDEEVPILFELICGVQPAISNDVNRT